MDNKKQNSLGSISFVIGIISIFTFQILIIPLLAAILGGISLSRFDSEKEKGRWMGGVGLLLGLLYTFAGSLRLLGF